MNRKKFELVGSVGDILKDFSDEGRAKRLLNLEKANLIKELKETGIEGREELKKSINYIEKTKKFLKEV